MGNAPREMPNGIHLLCLDQGLLGLLAGRDLCLQIARALADPLLQIFVGLSQRVLNVFPLGDLRLQGRRPLSHPEFQFVPRLAQFLHEPMFLGNIPRHAGRTDDISLFVRVPNTH